MAFELAVYALGIAVFSLAAILWVETGVRVYTVIDDTASFVVRRTYRALVGKSVERLENADILPLVEQVKVVGRVDRKWEILSRRGRAWSME